MTSLLQAFRSLRREPGLAAGAIATLALAIGVTATMLELVTRLMLSAPPGIREPDRIARVMMELDFGGGQKFSMSTTSYPFFRQVSELGAFSSTAAVAPTNVILGTGGDAK